MVVKLHEGCREVKDPESSMGFRAGLAADTTVQEGAGNHPPHHSCPADPVWSPGTLESSHLVGVCGSPQQNCRRTVVFINASRRHSELANSILHPTEQQGRPGNVHFGFLALEM